MNKIHPSWTPLDLSTLKLVRVRLYHGQYLVFSDPILFAILEQNYGDDSDVVRAHHQGNGFPRAPAPGRLRAIRNWQQPSTRTTVLEPDQNVMSSVVQHSQPSEFTGAPTVLIAADGELTGQPMKLRSYPNKFHEVIEWAKLIVQCDAATKDPFPSRSTFLDTLSGEFFNEALAECTNIPPGKSLLFELTLT